MPNQVNGTFDREIYTFHNAESVLKFVEILVNASLFAHSKNVKLENLRHNFDKQLELTTDDIGH